MLPARLTALPSRAGFRAARRTLGLTVVLAGLLAVPAHADAPIAVAAATQGNIVVNGDGSRTVTVQGQWEWPTMHSDCSLSRAGAGYAVNWDDPSQPGNFVTALNSSAISVGAAAANGYNPADNLVHATPPGHDSTSPGLWRSGCGAFAAPPGFSTGSWGPISHTYPPSYVGAIAVCPVLYDVGGRAGHGPTGSTQIMAGGRRHNEDNSVQGNGRTPTGDTCFTDGVKSQPALAVTGPAVATVGSPVTGTVNLSGGFQPGGTLSVALYGASDPTCAGTPVFAKTVLVNGNGNYGAASYVPASAGTYHWVASYGGDANNLPTTPNACTAPGSTMVVSATTPQPAQTPSSTPSSTSTGSSSSTSQSSGSTSTHPSASNPSAATQPIPPVASMVAQGMPLTTLPGAVPATPAPVLGETAGVALTQGTVRLARPGGGFQTVTAGMSLPFNTVIDASDGAVVLATARDAAGTPQEAALGGGAFVLKQTQSSGHTTIVPTGGSFTQTCGSSAHASSAHMARAAASRGRHRAVRRLWTADNHGDYSTRGLNSVAIVRGTVWVTTEGCDGTRTTVIEGEVSVTNERTGRQVLLGPGDTYLAHHHH